MPLVLLANNEIENRDYDIQEEDRGGIRILCGYGSALGYRTEMNVFVCLFHEANHTVRLRRLTRFKTRRLIWPRN